MRIRLLVAVIFSLLLLPGQANAAVCVSGAEVRSDSYCRLFRVFRARDRQVDARIVQRIAQAGGTVRSIALIVGIGSYGRLPGPERNLPAANRDVENLIQLLSDSQDFDEIIVLSNQDATRDNLTYFLREYLPQQGLENQGRARLLIAYSGHGTNEAPAKPASLVLYDAEGMDDSAHNYLMRDFGSDLSSLSQRYFHVLALINACYGANAIPDVVKGGGSLWATDRPGAYALIAGSDSNPVASLGNGRGSIFFDAIVEGIRTGQADPTSITYVSQGRLLQQGGIIRLSPLGTYVADSIDRVNRDNPSILNGRRLDEPWIAAVQPPSGPPARGAFFFLSTPRRLDGQTELLPVVSAPRSSLPGRPEVRVFGLAQDYPIRGIDISRFEGAIDWNVVAARAGIRFAYIRAIGMRGVDTNFQRNYDGAAQVRLDRGVYAVFDYCMSVEEQVERLAVLLGPNSPELPIAADLEIPIGTQQTQCATSQTRAQRNDRVFAFLSQLEARFHRTPIVYATRGLLEELLEPRFNRFMIWLGLWPNSRSISNQITLRGNNPWTLWQHGNGHVEGIGEQVDQNVFFGGEAEYESFKAGRGNVGLTAALAPG